MGGNPRGGHIEHPGVSHMPGPDLVKTVNKPYAFEEYPKALDPPPIEISSPKEERVFRTKHKMLLPFQGTNELAEVIQARTDGYYADQDYPKWMQPPQVIVNDLDEEAATLASWNMAGPAAADIVFPRYMFHFDNQPRVVRSKAEMDSLGADWFETIAEAADWGSRRGQPKAPAPVAARRPAPVSIDPADTARKAELRAECTRRGIKFFGGWGIDKLEGALRANAQQNPGGNAEPKAA